MKKVIWVAALSIQLLPAQAQLFSREAVGGAALGGLVGGIIGHNKGRQTAEGIAIGAGAGLLLGSLTHRANQSSYPPPPGLASPAPVYAYPSVQARPHYAVTGAAVGGLAGGIIGHNNGRRTAEGIAIGAGAGLLFGTLAEHEARRPQHQFVVVPASVAVPEPPMPPATPANPPPPTPVLNSFSSPPSAMSSANALFGR